MRIPLKIITITAAIAAVLLSCASDAAFLDSVYEGSVRASTHPGGSVYAAGDSSGKSGAGTGISDLQRKLVEGAGFVLGKSVLVIRDRTFPVDCSGVVLAIYYYAGIDLTREFARYTGNGVKRIHDMLRDRELLYRTPYPAPGDIIFWDNTYDRNGDNLWNDELTHVGMVVSTDRTGQVEYIHANVRKGIIFERMNLRNPDISTRTLRGELLTVNSPMRMMGSPRGPGWLSSHLFKVFGRGYELRF